MALRFIDGFDHYATGDLGKKWSTVTGAVTIVAGQGRRGSQAMQGAGVSRYLGLVLDPQPVWMVGCALRYDTLPTAGPAPFLTIRDATNSQVQLCVGVAGNLVVLDGANAVLATSTPALSMNTYHYIETRVVIHNTAGEVEVRVNGIAWITLTGVDTQFTTNATARDFRLGNIGAVNLNLGVPFFDDVYICDGTGSAPHNTFLGDCRVDTLFPTVDGTAQQWTPSTPGTHYTLVDDTTPNTTDYVSSSTVGHRETYGMQDLTAVTGTIYGLQLNLAALKSDAGVRSIKPLILSGASEALGGATALSTSQAYIVRLQPTDPATGAAWTEAGVNAVQCGAEVA